MIKSTGIHVYRDLNKTLIIIFTLAVSTISAQNFVDDFRKESIGDFPSNWDLLKGTAQVDVIEGLKAIKLGDESIISLKTSQEDMLGDTFVLSFDLYFDKVQKSVGYQWYKLRLWPGTGAGKVITNHGTKSYRAITIKRHGAGTTTRGKGPGDNAEYGQYLNELRDTEATWRNIKVSFANNTLKLFIEEEMVSIIPNYEFNPSQISFEGAGSASLLKGLTNIEISGSKGIVSIDGQEQKGVRHEPIGETEKNIGDTTPSNQDILLNTEKTEVDIAEEILTNNAPQYEEANFNISTSLSPDQVDQLVYEEMIRLNIPGLALGIYQKDSIEFAKGYGYKDAEHTKALSKYSVLRWASISKTLTAVATLQIVENDMLELDDKVVELYPYYVDNNNIGGLLQVPDFERKKQITINQLLTNRGGLSHYGRDKDDSVIQGYFYEPSEYTSKGGDFNADSAVDLFRIHPLANDPGEYLYSTFGFNLLGAVLDEVTGSYTKWVKDSIQNKLGLESLRIANTESVGVYMLKDSQIKTRTSGSKEHVLPGGGWESNIIDLMRFGKGIVRGKLLNRTFELWERDYNDNPLYRRGVMAEGKETRTKVYHNGTHGNLKSSLTMLPYKDITVAILIPANYVDEGQEYYLANQILEKLQNNK